jgi:hypothetical protein
MVEYAIVAAAIVIAGLCIARRLTRAVAATRGCSGGGGCSSEGAAKREPGRMGKRQELVQLTVQKPSRNDGAETDGGPSPKQDAPAGRTHGT